MEATPISVRPLTHNQRMAVIDEFGDLQAKVDAFKPTRERHAVIREQIASWYSRAPGTQPFLELGSRYALQVSECTNERSIFSMAHLFRKLGLDTFLKLCKFPLAAVDVAVPQAEHNDFIEETQTGPRKIKVVPRAGKAKPVPARIPTRMAA